LRYPYVFLIIILSCILQSNISAQNIDSSMQKRISNFENIPTNLVNKIERKYSSIESSITQTELKVLNRLQKKELQLQKKLAKVDSISAKNIFGGVEAKYNSMLQKVQNPTMKLGAGSLNHYIPQLDSLQTAFHFMDKAGGKIPGISIDKLQQIKALSSQLNGLQAQLQSSGDITQFIKERKQLLTEQLNKFGLQDQLKNINKQVYYYQQQMIEYKAMLTDPDKLTNKALSLVREIPAFKAFMQKNSLLAQLFPMPSDIGTSQALAGLQTRTQVTGQLTQLIGSSGSGINPQQYAQQQLQGAQTEINQLKDKINKFGGGSSDLVTPDFKPNNQKTKSFWKRIEYGLNVQSQKPNGLLPVTTDMAVTIGYKLNDKSIMGLGAAYKMGWGKDVNHISISSQGIGLRSYVDIKLKGSIWITGGYEQNYMQGFEKIPLLIDYSKWQQSGLIGLSKKYKVNKKTGNMQLLWDLMSYRQVPQTQPLKFRIGYTF
jgi:hypothetical protein